MGVDPESGATGSLLSTTILYPLDTCKTKYQAEVRARGQQRYSGTLVDGDGGNSWDDGVFDGVRKVYIGQGFHSIAFVKFEYYMGGELVTGDDHGQMTLLGTEEFELNYPNEYMTSVEGYDDRILGYDAPLIMSLRFRTNQRTSQPFGIEEGRQFVLEERGYKIVGFRGQEAGDKLRRLGVNLVRIAN